MSEKVVAGIRAREDARKPQVVEPKAQKAKLDAVREKVDENRVAISDALTAVDQPVEPA